MPNEPTLNGDMKISEIIRNFPQTKDVFLAHGFEALVSEDGMRVLAPFLSLKTALRSRFISSATFLKLLEEAISGQSDQEAPGLTDYARQGELTLLALMPCGLKMPFSRTFSAFIEEQKSTGTLDITYAIEGNLNQELSYYPYVNGLETADELPDIILSSDFNTFYGKRFYERFVSTGAFTGHDPEAVNQSFIDAGIIEPSSAYTVIAANPLVMVVNKDQLGDRTPPARWQDILDPQWQKSIVLRGGNGFFCHAVLLPIYKNYGAEGLKKLAANVLHGLHPSQMVKQIDANNPGAIYVMPEFFAHRVQNKERIQIIWPEDGALASPVTLQVKSSERERLKPIVDYLTGKEFGQSLANAGFPVVSDGIMAEVQHKPLAWLGWDYLRSHDLPKLNVEIDEIFMPEVSAA